MNALQSDTEVVCVRIPPHGPWKEFSCKHGDVYKRFATGSTLQIVGAIPELDVIAVAANPTDAPPNDAPEVNAHRLRGNFEEEIRGDLVLVRTRGRAAIPRDVRISDLANFLREEK